MRTKKKNALFLMIGSLTLSSLALAVGGVDGGSNEQPFEIELAQRNLENKHELYCTTHTYYDRELYLVGSPQHPQGVANSTVMKVLLDPVSMKIETEAFNISLSGIDDPNSIATPNSERINAREIKIKEMEYDINPNTLIAQLSKQAGYLLGAIAENEPYEALMENGRVDTHYNNTIILNFAKMSLEYRNKDKMISVAFNCSYKNPEAQ